MSIFDFCGPTSQPEISILIKLVTLQFSSNSFKPGQLGYYANLFGIICGNLNKPSQQILICPSQILGTAAYQHLSPYTFGIAKAAHKPHIYTPWVHIAHHFQLLINWGLDHPNIYYCLNHPLHRLDQTTTLPSLLPQVQAERPQCCDQPLSVFEHDSTFETTLHYKNQLVVPLEALHSGIPQVEWVYNGCLSDALRDTVLPTPGVL
ncbi:hypothetical protein O181_000214 [Austropuccinia psidii MF-1]|uniref:Uncharacterized protein n=1 Tax=Austropuccinia psidii MF-1 TaxID=1389203 RepID=A0A9Q3B877_9BASI|nr:hypothetical protein [Austropuccinia psidii MF-1]